MKSALLLAAVSQLALTGVAIAETKSASPISGRPEAAAPSAMTSEDPATQSPPAQPQAAPQTATDDIVVTARRREENVQDVPISITAVSGQSLTNRGVRDALDLQYQTPSLTVTSAGASRATVAYSIRGQRSQELQLLTDSPVGTYFAEVVTPRPYGFGTSFYDLQNVQVLKGVQGTLFGRNMTGGAVLVEPNHPDLTAYHAEAVAQYGNYDMVDVSGMANVPIVKDVFGLRVAGKFRDRTGFTRDVSTGRDYDDQHYYAFRVSSQLDLGRFKSFTVFDYLNEREHGAGLKLTDYSFTDPRNGQPTVIAQQIGASPFFPVAAGVPPENLAATLARDVKLGRYQVNYGNIGNNALDGGSGMPFMRLKNWGITNKTTFEAGDVTFKNIFGYRKIEYTNHSDYDGSATSLIYPTQFSNTHDYSEEFQMQGTPLGSRLQLTLGAYYFAESGEDGAYTNSFPQLTSIGFASATPALAGYFLTLPASSYIQSQVGVGLARSYAFYGAGTYTITEKLKFSGGLRYNNDLRRATVSPRYDNLTIPGAGTGFCLYNGLGALPVSQCAQTRTLKNEAVTWDATLQYEPVDDLNVYAAARRGYRAGGYNLRAQSDATFRPFQPETVNEYEIGLKKTFDFGGGTRLTANGAVYFQNYKNIQKQGQILIGTNIATVITNTGAQHNYGGEFELNLRMANGLSLNAFYSYINDEVVRGDNGQYPMWGVPHHQAGGGISYNRSLPGVGGLTANVNGTYRSKLPLDDFDPTGIQPGYFIANARVGIDRIAGSNFGIAAFVSNITNKYYQLGGLYLNSNGPVINGVNPGGGPGFAAATYGEPRMYGLELSAKF